MPAAIPTTSVARSILLVVGASLTVMEGAAIAYRAHFEWADVSTRAIHRAEVALGLLEAVHEQAMLNARSDNRADPATATLDGAVAKFSSGDTDLRLWMAMGPKLVSQQTAAHPNEPSHLELPRDRVDRAAIAGGKTSIGIVDDWMRVTRPSIMGVGTASAPRCASCHSNIAKGEVIGSFSAAVNLAKPKAQWWSDVVFDVTSALGIVLISLGVIAALLTATTLAPLRRLAVSTGRLATGILSVKVDGAERTDELGTVARSLEVFRRNLVEKRDAEEKLEHMALHDGLTGLPNRTGLHKFLQQAVAGCAPGSKIAVASIDLDDFKEVNDLHGQSAGDDMLRAVAARLIEVSLSGEFIARVGGDEFIAFKAFKEQTQLFEFIGRLKGAMQTEICVAGGSKTSAARIGVAIWPDDAQTTDALVAKADNALQRAKSDAVRCVCYFEAALDTAARRRRQLVVSLQGAAGRGELYLDYQVQKQIVDLRTTGFEALLRWRHPELGLISPGEFIPIAEQCGAIVEIGEWVLRTACREAAQWPIPYAVAVNISPLQLARPEFDSLVRDVLIETGLDPKRLELEITETAIIDDRVQALEALRKLRELDISIALDDFGRGYSSLETLRLFPFSKIKLDRFFVTELVTSKEARAIIRAIVAMGQSLGVPVLAEGIETQDQLAILRREHCRDGQGFLFGRPGPMNDFHEDSRYAS